MVEQRPEKASNFLKDKIFFLIFFMLMIYGCESSSFNNFDDKLIIRQLELQNFSEKSTLRKEVILENINE